MQLNMTPELAGRLDAFIAANPGLSRTVVIELALRHWLAAPELPDKLPVPVSDEDIDMVLRKNADLMEDLSR